MLNYDVNGERLGDAFLCAKKLPGPFCVTGVSSGYI